MKPRLREYAYMALAAVLALYVVGRQDMEAATVTERIVLDRVEQINAGAQKLPAAAACGLPFESGGMYACRDAARLATSAQQSAAPAPYMDCQRLLRDGSWLRWQIAQRADRGEWRIDCDYGDRGDVRL